MSSCATVPTETQFGTSVITTNSVSTSISVGFTTLPPTTVTSTATICLDVIPSASCSSTLISTLISTSPGSTVSISSPVAVTVPVTLTSSGATNTLFSTSCIATTTSTSSSTTSSATTTTPSTSTTSVTPLSTSSSSISSSTPPPSSSLPNGSVVTSDVLLTSTMAPSSVYVTAPPSASYNQVSGGGGGSSSSAAPIAGGVAGGLVALLAILGGVWYVWRRSRRWNDIFDKEEEKHAHRTRMSLDGDDDVQPRPYHYGLVGNSMSPSPPNSPPLGAVHNAHSPSNSLSLLNAPPNHHSRSSSGVALPSPGFMPYSLSDLGNAPTTTPTSHSGHTRPNTSSSTAGSTGPLLERSVNHPRPPTSWSAGGQSIGPGIEPASTGRPHSPPLSPRPHSTTGNMQSTAGLSAIPDGAIASMNPAPPHSSPVSEKRRLRALPTGAAAPTTPSAAALASPSAPVPRGNTLPPPILPRNPNRPSSAKTGVVVHVDGGPAGSGNVEQSRSGNEPPAYSPT